LEGMGRERWEMGWQRKAGDRCGGIDHIKPMGTGKVEPVGIAIKPGDSPVCEFPGARWQVWLGGGI
jgi:hypothetical protein